MTYQANIAERPGSRLAIDRVNWPIAIPLAIGIVALALPTLRSVAAVSWSTEQGAHGPIVLAIAIWLFVRRWPEMRAHARPGSALLGGAVLAVTLLAYVATRIVGSVVLESMSLYGALVATLYLLVGWRSMKAAWFPICYFLFVLPPPGQVVVEATQPLRLWVSSVAVWLMSGVGLPVAKEGLTMYIGQYALEVQAACSGLNSIISLSAIGLFYAYIRHSSNVRYMAVLAVVIVAMALLANLTRVILLVLITYYMGNEAAQGFLHQFAGMTMFVVALLGTIAFDALAERLWPGLVHTGNREVRA